MIEPNAKQKNEKSQYHVLGESKDANKLLQSMLVGYKNLKTKLWKFYIRN